MNSVNIRNIIKESIQVKNVMLDTCIEELKDAAILMANSIKNGNKLIWCGNGGSAADAQHMSTELMGGLRDHSRPAIPSIALTTDSSFLTAWANDTDYDTIFSRQIEGLGQAGDVLIAISTSGNSKNVIRAIRVAKEKNISVVTLTGETGGDMKHLGDIEIQIPSQDTQRIQEGHLLAEHILCEYVEATLFG